MNYYLDFEALRFSDQIISIGCVSENGEEFYSLVKPKKHKVDNFITQLTGITKEMLVNAPSSEEAFEKLFDYVAETDDCYAPKFYVYGNYDETCLRATLRATIGNIKAQMMILSILGNLNDYSKDIETFFGLGQTISLRKAYIVFKDLKDYVQEHNALGDAIMLKEVVERTPRKCSNNMKMRVLDVRPQPNDRPAKKKVENPIWKDWLNMPKEKKWDAPTGADESNWRVKVMTASQKIYFHSLEDAALWLMRFGMVTGVSPKNKQDIQNVMKRIKQYYNFCGYVWTIKEEE